MGAVFNRLWSKGFLGGFGTPQVHPELEKLLGWSREELQYAFQRFCTKPSLAVTVDSFADIVRLESSSEERAAFQRLKPNRERVDMLSVFGAMVATSNQRFISRVSFLFSIFDLDSSGTINRAEFVIGVRALLKGISCFFESAVLPSKRELEDMTVEVFERIDADRSGFITIGELLNYSYRSGELKKFLDPFPAEDDRLFEQLIVFVRDNDEFAQASEEALRKWEHKLDLSPGGSFVDSSSRRTRRNSSFQMGGTRRSQFSVRREGPPKAPKQFTKAHTWFVYRVFALMAGGGMQTTINSDDLQKMLEDHRAVDDILTKVSSAAGEVIGPRERTTNGTRRVSIAGDTQDLNKLIAHLRRYFNDRHAVAKLDTLGQGNITMRAFFCVVLHSLSEGEIETCLRWCQAFRAHDVLKEFMSTGNTQRLNFEDVRLIFQAMDTDGNGALSLEELMVGGELDEATARQLMKRLDEDESGTVTVDELQGILRSIDTQLRSDFKDCFESHLQGPAFTVTPSMNMTS